MIITAGHILSKAKKGQFLLAMRITVLKAYE